MEAILTDWVLHERELSKFRSDLVITFVSMKYTTYNVNKLAWIEECVKTLE